MTALPITGKVPPPVTIANASPSDGLGLRSVLPMESFVSIRIRAECRSSRSHSR